MKNISTNSKHYMGKQIPGTPQKGDTTHDVTESLERARSGSQLRPGACATHFDLVLSQRGAANGVNSVNTAQLNRVRR